MCLLSSNCLGGADAIMGGLRVVARTRGGGGRGEASKDFEEGTCKNFCSEFNAT